MDKRLEEIDNELGQLNTLRNRITWLEYVLTKLPITMDQYGTIYSTLPMWLLDGKEYLKHTRTYVNGLCLIDRKPYFNDRRQLWYYYCEPDNQLEPTNKGWQDPCTIPLAIRNLMKPNKIDTQKLYYDDRARMEGWDTDKSAEKELNRAALEWAKT